MSCRIIIPEPCHEDWNKMAPTDKGRHCAACRKTVIDFSSWSLENIAAYLRKHSSLSICGRFRNQQLNVAIPYSPEQWVAQVAGTGLSLMQQVALLFLLAFGLLTSSCDTNSNDAPRQTTYQTTGLVMAPSYDSNTLGGIEATATEAQPPCSSDTTSAISTATKKKTVRLSKAHRKAQVPMTVQGDILVTAGAPMIEELPQVDTATGKAY
jgi:hypothetical protein